MRVRRPTRSKNGSITALGALLLVIVGTAAHSYFQQESQLSARLAQTTGGGGKRSSTKQAAGGGGDRDGDTAAAAGAAPGSIPRLSRELAHERARDGVIVVTWANLAFSDFVLNWAAAVQRQGIDNYLVGAMDQETAELLAARGVHVFAMYDEGQSSTGLTTDDFGWGTPLFHRMGRQKVDLAAAFTAFGLDLVLCDVDTVWMHDATDYFRSIPEADILASSDSLESRNAAGDPGLEVPECIHSALNIGLLFFRASDNTARFCRAWADALDADDKLWDQEAFNRMVHEGLLPFVPLPANERLVFGYNHSVVVGVLPVASFSSGQTFFVQRLFEVQEVKPYVVHTTFQYGGSEGKRHRLREALLWEDPPEYYAEGLFLAIELQVPPTPADLESWTDDAMVDFHLATMKEQLRQLRDGLALALVLDRIAIMPKLMCFADRYWGPLEKGRIPGARATRLPFVCPMDHVLVPGHFADNPGPHSPALRYREHSFLDNERTPAEVKEGGVRLQADPQATGVTVKKEGHVRLVVLPAGRTDAELREALAPHAAAKLMRVSPADGLVRGFAEERDGAAFMERFLHALDFWCCRRVEPGQDGGVAYRSLFPEGNKW